MRQISIKEMHGAMRGQQVPFEDIAFVCPICHTVQSARSLIRAGAGASLDDVEKYVAFSCVGRWTNAGPHEPGRPPGHGCDWTLGGLFRLHKLEVVFPGDAPPRPSFELATGEQARVLMGVQP